MLAKIMNWLNSLWASMVSGFNATIHYLKKLWIHKLAYLGFIVGSYKAVYDNAIYYFNEMISKLNSIDSSGLSASLDVGASNALAFASYIFPLNYLVQCVVVIFSFWSVCLIIRLKSYLVGVFRR